MSYGVLIRGNSGQTIIDDSNPCIHIAVSGIYGVQITNEAIVNYPSTIQSPYEPYVYFRPNGPHQIHLFRHIGSPGNWTGFTFWQNICRDVDPSVHGEKRKTGAVMLPKAEGREMQVFDTQSRVIFDSNRDIVCHLGGTQAWNRYAYNPSWPGGLASQTWYLPFPYGTEAYSQVSHFNVSVFTTVEAPRIGFLENPTSLVFVSSIVQTETNQQFNQPLIAAA